MSLYSLLRPLLFRLPPALAHELGLAALAPFEHASWARALLAAALRAPHVTRATRDTGGVRVMGLDFPSVVGLAGGFDKNARRPRALAALGFGHIELGTVTARAQEANPSPNLFRLPADRALVNRLGFPNEGATHVAARLRGLRGSLPVPLGVSIGKSRTVAVDDLSAVVADYEASFDAVHSVADFVVVNVSSPNTTGLRTMQARDHARTLLSALRTRGAAPGRSRNDVRLLVKIAPDLDDGPLEDVLSVVEEVGLDGVIATNTTITRVGLATPPGRVEAIGAGGLSGAPLRARSLAVVGRVRARLGRKLAVVGVGGIERSEHALAMLRAGADLVQMYTGFIYEGPGAPSRIARELAALAGREGLASVAELVGTGA